VHAADEAAIVDLYRRASESSLRSRFLTAAPTAVADDVRRLVRPPDEDHVAVVAVDRGRVLAVGCWERTGATTAEWALLVGEGSHGHGIGTLIVEHLFAAARDAGITRMTADVLADNARMLRVLSDLGATRRTSLEAGVLRVEIPIEDSSAWRSAVAARESRAEHASLHRILCPRSIVVIGAGHRERSPGRRLLAGLLAGGYDGGVYAVNRTGTPVLGVPTARSVTALGVPVDVAVVAVPAESVLDVVRDCASAGVYGVVVISDGFAEIGAEGARRQAQLAALVREAGMRLVGPNCLGFVSSAEGRHVYATFSVVRPPAGPVGLVSQSGGVGLALLEYVTRHRLGLSSFVSVGNKADVSGNDLLMYWEHDDATTVCALYLESFGNARKFARIARRIARRKPIVAVTAGRSVAGARGTRSHTAAASTPDVALGALFRQAGVIRAGSLSEMLDIVALLARAPLPAGRRVAVVSNSGGPAALAADACAAADLELPALSEPTRLRLAALTAGHASTANPVDTTAGEVRTGIDAELADAPPA
jgi:succinyl-CoA synthetase alpha subunit/GNAT superfamily N-acetyltransferase